MEIGACGHVPVLTSPDSVPVQLLQELLWLAPNAYSLVHPCAWFGKFVSICGLLRWSLWNFVSPLFQTLHPVTPGRTLKWIDKSFMCWLAVKPDSVRYACADNADLCHPGPQHKPLD